jgi:hypothetical protein
VRIFFEPRDESSCSLRCAVGLNLRAVSPRRTGPHTQASSDDGMNPSNNPLSLDSFGVPQTGASARAPELTDPSKAPGPWRRVPLLLLVMLAARLDLQAQELPIKVYATAEGLAHVRVNRIVRDSRGFLRFCTVGGLSRFDGYAFATFGTEQGLPHSSVNDLLETRTGEYWVATDGGLVRFDPKGKPDRRVVYDSSAIASASMFTVVAPDDGEQRAKAITVLREGRDGTIWVGTNAGLYRLEHSNGRRSLRPVDVHIPNEFPEQRIIADILEDARGSLWIAGPRGLYRRWPDGSAARYTKRDGLPGDYLSDLLEDHEGHLWAATRHNGFFRFGVDTTHRAPVVDLKFTYPDSYGLPTFWVFQLFETSDHRFWVATARGVAEYVPAADSLGRFRPYAARNGLTDFDRQRPNPHRRRRRGAPWVCQLHHRARPVEQRHRSDR